MVLRALDLERHGLRILRAEARACAPTLDGRALTLWADGGRAAQEVAAFSPRDADAYPRFVAAVARAAGVLNRLMSETPPEIGKPRAADLLSIIAQKL